MNLAAARLGTWREFSSLSCEPLGSGTVSQPGHCGITVGSFCFLVL